MLRSFVRWIEGGHVFDGHVSKLSDLLLLEGLSRSLQRGFPDTPAARNTGKQRRRIPKELVLRIFWFCGFHRPRFEPLITTTLLAHPRGIHSAGPVVKSKCAESAPLSSRDVRRLCGLQIATLSHHQGWVSVPDAGSWSWFELSVIHPDDEDTEIVTVQSHNHPVDAAPGPQRWNSGDVFATGSENIASILQGIVETPGSKLVVKACARFPGWSNIVYGVHVTARDIYEPLF